MTAESGIIKRLQANSTKINEGCWRLTALDNGPIELEVKQGPSFALDRNKEWFVLPMDSENSTIAGRDYAWVLPTDPDSSDSSWLIKADGEIRLSVVNENIIVKVYAESCELIAYESRPQADSFGKRFRFEFEHGEKLGHTLAALYWGTMLPSVIERTRAKDYPISDGYVLSTLHSKYSGTYPDVDHEFQIKGRLSWGNGLDYDVVRRMIELQLKLMIEDPEGLWRNPCAIQPNGDREYHVRRSSLDGSTNAIMFLITGNVEVLESAWLYCAATKDFDWLRQHIEGLEGAASCIIDQVDRHGRLWSDVYYEDQVIKDGRETFATALAAHSLNLLAELERRLGNEEKETYYKDMAALLGASLAKPLPMGYWDETNQRFVDWVDRSGIAHDHIHLLANILPVLFGYASKEQEEHITALIDEHIDQFQRFPTFLAAHIDQYTQAEIGDGGPYDLCAAGRYWCWDAAYWTWKSNRKVLLGQLMRVSEQAAKEGYVMGERYDMNYVYYIDDKDWHGAAHYYEYPCVYSWVLIHEYLGIRQTFEADLQISPKVMDYGSVLLEQSGYQLSYKYEEHAFQLTNLGSESRSFEVDLTAIYPACTKWKFTCEGVDSVVEQGAIVRIDGGLTGTWMPVV
ncbi:glucosidase family protein [Paenibacillus albus]|uniref:Alpha-L-rhamnosidase six-hairpin glycosidase domain-containing protein n=1 Tax=Paenibacillus albus TaxID=2495582 RepID=A0A3S9A796_9BACL|nr:hypothetical protein [Paenibacillus albus]AZN41659.1 hypothetical protein EJC50_19740 [Paenibacillus albus]